MAELPGGSEFRRRWKALRVRERFRVLFLALRGRVAPDPDQRVLVAAYAHQERQPRRLVTRLGSTLIGVAIAELTLRPPGSSVLADVLGALLGVALAALLARHYLGRAERRNVRALGDRDSPDD
ncbi:MAG: hypothetical protein M3Q23_07515 [Actinomycetota bacterium]|nr:hypothetical protein [Actinomycetota bacterium]